MQDIILFGCGNYYKSNIEKIRPYVKVVGLLDNNEEKIGTYIEGIKVHSPSCINELTYDKIILLAAGTIARKMYEQLIFLGVNKNDIQFLDMFYGEIFSDYYEEYGKSVRNKSCKNTKIGIISVALEHNGGSIAASNLARALKYDNNEVFLIVPDAESDLIKELLKEEINIIVSPSIVCMSEKHTRWILDFDFLVINTFQMIDVVVKSSRVRDVVWWIHEPSDKYSNIYSNTLARYPEYRNNKFDRVKIYAVSPIAKRNFNEHYPNIQCGIMPYALPDYVKDKGYVKNSDEVLHFALIALVCPLKAQKEFLIAASKIAQNYSDKVEFWIIGKMVESIYSDEVRNLAERIPNVSIMGLKTQEEIRELYREMDVVVCPSYEDCLPIVVTEGFMNAKTCIVSSNTGSAYYITDGVNGLICEPGSGDSLVECMEWCIDNKEKLNEMGEQARAIYEDYFSMNFLRKNMRLLMNDFGENILCDIE